MSEPREEVRRQRLYVILGRLGSIKHSLYSFLRPLRVGESYPTDKIERDNVAHAMRVKATGLREIADLLDQMADDVEDE